MDAQAGLCLCCSQPTEDRFSRGEAHMFSSFVAVDGLCDLHILKGTSTEDQVCAAIPNEGSDKVRHKT